MDIGINQVLYKMNQLEVIHRFYKNKAAAEHGLYVGQLPILEYIDTHYQCVQKEMAKELGVTPSSVATSVKRMEKSGLLNKVIDTEDMRFTRLTLTNKGRAVAKACRKSFNQVESTMFKDFSSDEYKILYNLCARIVGNLTLEELKSDTIQFMEEIDNRLSAESSQDED